MKAFIAGDKRHELTKKEVVCCSIRTKFRKSRENTLGNLRNLYNIGRLMEPNLRVICYGIRFQALPNNYAQSLKRKQVCAACWSLRLVMISRKKEA